MHRKRLAILGSCVLVCGVGRWATAQDCPPKGTKFISEFLVTPSMVAPAGCGVTAAMISGDWLTGTADGDPITDADIIPTEGMVIQPAFGAPSQATGWHNGVTQASKDLFWTNPADVATTNGKLVKINSASEIYDWQRADIYGADINLTMNVAFFYVVNTSGARQVMRMGFGSDDGGGVRVNGRIALAMQACRGTTAGQDKFRVCLDPGKNLISFYTFEDGGGYSAALRFEDENGTPLPVLTTLDPTGYNPDPAAHPECILDPLPPTGIQEVLVTPSMKATAGCAVTAVMMAGNWIAGQLASGDELTEGGIVPSEGLEFYPDFGFGSQATNWDLGMSPAAQANFLVDSGSPGIFLGKLVKVSSGNGNYDWQRGDIYGADINQTMNVAYFYVVNDTAGVVTRDLGFGSDDGGAVWVNGRPALLMPACRGVTPGQDKFRICLDPGKNLIAIYTFEDGGGYGAALRFENVLGGAVSMATTVDSTGYVPDPDGSLGIHPVCTPAPKPDAPVYTSDGIVTEFLVPARILDQPLTSNTIAGALPEDYISINGAAPSVDNVREGAAAGPGTTGAITTKVRGASNDDCRTVLSRFRGKASLDPGLFNGEVYYGNPDNYSSTLFFFVNNKTGAPLDAGFGFASDDAATLFVNGERILEFLVGRGFGGANELQTGPGLATLNPGLNLVQLSYNEGGGGSGARVGFGDPCLVPFSAEMVEVSANPPGVGPPAITPCSLSCPPTPKFISEFLVTPAMVAPAGCGVTAAMISGDWLTGTADGAPVTDADIVPEEDMVIQPAFGAPSQATAWHNLVTQASKDTFWTIPTDVAATNGKLVKINSAGEIYDWQRADIYGADINLTMNVAFVYVVNNSAERQVMRMGFGSDDGGGVRVNGRIALAMQACRGTTAGQDKFRVCLDPGKNLISLYTFEDGGGFSAALRFEDENGTPIAVDSTLDPTGYNPDPAAHPECILDPLPPTGIQEVLVTPSMKATAGCAVTAVMMAGNWIAGQLASGDELTEGGIVPSEGLEFYPDFGFGSQATNWDLGMSPAAQANFLVDSGSPGIFLGKLVKVSSGNGNYDWQRGDIYGADINQTMNVAYFYVVNDTAGVVTRDLGFGSDDGGAVWVNGRPALLMPACRGVTPGQDKFRICLDPGKNLIAIYTFEDGGGYGAALRFENALGGAVTMATTVDPTGYVPDPDGSLGIHPVCTPGPKPDAPVYTSDGIVTEFLVPARILDQPLTSNTIAGALPEDYISIDGDAPSAANVREGAEVGPGTTGAITTAVRGDTGGCTTFLRRFRGLAGLDPGLFNGEVYYGNPDNYSSTLFFFLNNKTGGPFNVSVLFASDDAASLYVNGELILEFLVGRGFGGANELQTGPGLATLNSGLNLVQLSYNEGGGGSGARVGVKDLCGGLLDPSQVEVSANPPGFEPPALPGDTLVCPSEGGNQKPGDENQDGNLNIADPISILDHLFRGTNPELPCGDGTREDPANLKLLDSNGDGSINITDPIHALSYLFLGGPPPASCAGNVACPCIAIVDCPDACVE